MRLGNRFEEGRQIIPMRRQKRKVLCVVEAMVLADSPERQVNKPEVNKPARSQQANKCGAIDSEGSRAASLPRRTIRHIGYPPNWLGYAAIAKSPDSRCGRFTDPSGCGG